MDSVAEGEQRPLLAMKLNNVAPFEGEHVQYADTLESALQAAQEQNGGWVSRELMDAVADYLDMPPVLVYEVGTWYSVSGRGASWSMRLARAFEEPPGSIVTP